MPMQIRRERRGGMDAPRWRTWATVSVLATVSALAASHSIAAETVYVSRGGEWRFLPGLGEASSPDPAAWRFAGFDDALWSEDPAPFGFGDPPYGTDLSELDPPMRRNYSSIYLRRTFEVADPDQIVALRAMVLFDDGFIVWINGVEVLRANAPESPTFDAEASSSHEGREYEPFDELPEPQSFLVPGTNTVAVHAFNVSAASNDFGFDIELLDPFGPDLAPPRVERLVPPSGRTVRSLERIEVTFDEDVTGVDAADLLVDGHPARAVSGEARGPWVFELDRVEDGERVVRWAENHGITDLAPAANAFAGGEWSYTVDSNAPPDDIVISELVARASSGADALLDEDREASDWIELHNRGGLATDLTGWSLTDDPEESDKWIFPPLVLEPDEYVVVFASGKDRATPNGELHTSFRLSSSGEYLGLYDASSPRKAMSEYAKRYPEQRLGFAYGLDASDRAGYLFPPTPGAPNPETSTARAILPPPVFTVERGFHDDAFTLEILPPLLGATVRYTLDGTEPTLESGREASESIEIAGAPGRGVVTVRAAAFADEYLPSRTITHSYVFPTAVLEQPNAPSDFPLRWGTQTADYAVDSSVVAPDPAAARAALLSIPTLSIVTGIDDIFGPTTGIYANPSRSGIGWERAVSAEFLYPDGSAPVQVDCGVRIQGGSSTSGWKSTKLSMRLRFTSDYGPKELHAPLFPDSPVDRFDTVVLDAHLNLAYTHPDHAQRVRSLFVRDILVADLQNAAGSLAPHGRFMHLYLNGLYWGMYDVHERPDDSFASEYLGGDEDEWDIYRHNSSTLVDGNALAWTKMFQLARPATILRDPSGYLALGEWLDIPDLCDYMIVNFYAGNTDWAHQNWYAGRRRIDAAGYRFFSWDAEHTFKEVGDNVTGVSQSGGPGELYANLRQSEEFRVLFGDRVHRHFSEGGIFWVDPENPAVDPDHPERNRPGAFYERRIDEIYDAVLLESARWGDARRPGLPYTRDREFLAEHRRLLEGYFPRRSSIVLAQLRGIGLYPRIEAPRISRPGGDVEAGTTIELSLPEGSEGRILYTLDGSDPRTFGTGEVSPVAREFSGPVPIDSHVALRARTLDGGTWSALAEADYSTVRPRDALRVTEIYYNAPGGRAGEFLELANVSRASLGLAGLRFTSGITYEFAAGARLSPDETVVLVADLAGFEAEHPGAVAFGVYEGSLSDGGERLTLEDSDGEIVFSFEWHDDGDWPRGPDGLGWSLVLRDASADPNVSSSWTASRMPGGSPGVQGDAGDDYGIVINEVLSRTEPPLEDAVELFNPTAAPIDLGGWYLSDDGGDADALRKFLIPGGTVIAPGGFAVFYESDFADPALGESSFALGADGDEIFLSAADGAGELTGWIVARKFPAAANAVSFGRVETNAGVDFYPLERPTFGVDDPPTVVAFRTGRGAANAPPRIGPLVLNEIHYHPAIGVEFVEIRNVTEDDVPLFDAELGAGWRLDGLRDALDIGPFEFPPGAAVPAGGFLVLVPIDPEVFRALRDISPDVAIVGPYGGALDNSGERLGLLEPSLHSDGTTLWSIVDSVKYEDGGLWPDLPDGGGPSLERLFALEYAGEPENWAPSELGGGTPGAPNSAEATLPNRAPTADFVSIADPAAPLVVRFDGRSSRDVDGTIVAWSWDFGDGGTASEPEAVHEYRGPGDYIVALAVTDDDGAETVIERELRVGLVSAGGQQPGDADQSGRVNVSDAVAILRHLFAGAPLGAPCGGEPGTGGNLVAQDVDADDSITISDAVFLLRYIFERGPEPPLGASCIPVAGCAAVCTP